MNGQDKTSNCGSKWINTRLDIGLIGGYDNFGTKTLIYKLI